MLPLQQIGAYVKKYWSIGVLALGSILAFFLFFRRQSTFTDQLAQIQAAHDAQLAAIAKANAEAIAQHEANQRRLSDTLAAIQAKYDLEEIKLDVAKKEEISQLIKLHGDDPDALAQALSTATGFKILL